jgi:PAS domain S-box-containing protein
MTEYAAESSASVRASFRDSTGKESGLEVLMESEEKFRILAEHSPNMIFINQKGRVVYANKKAEEVMGYTQEEFCSPDFDYLDLIAQDSRESVKSAFDRHMKSEEIAPLEYRLVTREGKTMDAIINTKLIEYGGEPAILGVVTDITDRKKAERIALESQQKFKALFMGNPEATAYVGPDSLVREVNSRFSELFGFTSDEARGKTILELIVPEDKMVEGETLAQEAVKGYFYRDSVRKRKDGSRVAVSVSAAPVVMEGKLAGCICMYRDITLQKKMEQSLKESEEKLRVIIENTNCVYFSQGTDYVLTYVSPQVRQIFGYEPEEALGKWQTILSDNPVNLRGMELLQKAVDTSEQQPPHELEFVGKDGRKVWVEVRESPVVRDGKTVAIVGAATDITDRKKAEQGFQESKQKFEGLFKGNPEATVYLDPDMRIVDANPRFASLFGYSLDEARGRFLDDLIVPKDLVEEGSMLNRKAVEGYVYHDTVRARKDGSLVPVSISAAPILIQNKLIGSIGVYKDISVQKFAEKKLEMMNEKLRVVGGLTRHDVRNKLSVISGNIFLDRKRLKDNPVALESLKDMQSACEQIVSIFEFAKDYEKLGVEELAYINVEETVQEAASLFSDLRTKITNECHGLTVLADSLLRQVFYNLIDNSAKYGQKTTQIRIRYEKTAQDELKLVYEDDGVGIPAADKPKLFKEGYSTGGGTGHGLFLIKRMMEVYGWTIQETGEPGKGVQFTLAIPKTNKNGRENYHWLT